MSETFEVNATALLSQGRAMQDLAADMSTLARSTADSVGVVATGLGDLDTDLISAIHHFGKLWQSQATIVQHDLLHLSNITSTYAIAVSDVDKWGEQEFADPSP